VTLRDFTDDGQIVLPIGGTTYTVPPVSARLTLELLDYETAKDKDATRLGQLTEIELYRELLGPVFDQMVDDDRTLVELRMAGLYAYLHTVKGEAMADAYWDTEGKAPAPTNRATKRATKKATKPRASRSTAGARKTP
jgi:hypothetical protein